MASRYAKDQPSGFSNRIEHVAIVGAGGLMGGFISRALLATDHFKLTAITRKGSIDPPPSGTNVVHVDYSDPSTLVSALRGQQFLIVALSVLAPPGTHDTIIQAAIDAGVPYVMPNSFTFDIRNEALSKDQMASPDLPNAIKALEKSGTSSWISLICNLWYEYSLVNGPPWFGFDFDTKTLTYYDDGNTKINTTTFPQCARAVANLLSLPILPVDANDKSMTISHWANKPVYISSFLINQKDMFESWKRVSGDADSDWTFEHEPTIERHQRGKKMFQEGDRMGFGVANFSRIFYQNGDGQFEDKLDNEVLGLPKEDLDESTKIVKEMVDRGEKYIDRLRRPVPGQTE